MLTGKRPVETFFFRVSILLKLSSEVCVSQARVEISIFLRCPCRTSVYMYVRTGIRISVPYEKAEINVSKHILRHSWSEEAELV